MPGTHKKPLRLTCDSVLNTPSSEATEMAAVILHGLYGDGYMDEDGDDTPFVAGKLDEFAASRGIGVVKVSALIEATARAEAAERDLRGAQKVVEAARTYAEHVRTDYLRDGPGCSGMCDLAESVRSTLRAYDARPCAHRWTTFGADVERGLDSVTLCRDCGQVDASGKGAGDAE